MANIFDIFSIVCSFDVLLGFLRRKGLIADGWICNRCHRQCLVVVQRCGDGYAYKCGGCKKTFGSRKNSFFDNSNLSLRNIICIIYFFAQNETVSQTLLHLKGLVSRKAIEKYFGFLRLVCWRYSNRTMPKLGGRGVLAGTVEIDETCVGRKRKYNRGFHRGQQSWVFGMVDIKTKKCHVQVVPNRTRHTLLPIILEHVERGSRIHSDEAPVYHNLTRLGFDHHTVNHSVNYVGWDGTHTNNIENLWSHLKTTFKASRGFQKHKIHLHVAEFVYRWNNKFEDDFFGVLLDEIALQFPL